METLVDGPALLRGKALDDDGDAPALCTFSGVAFGSGGASRHLITCEFAWEMRTDFWHTGQEVNRDADDVAAAAAADDAPGEEEVANAEDHNTVRVRAVSLLLAV